MGCVRVPICPILIGRGSLFRAVAALRGEAVLRQLQVEPVREAKMMMDGADQQEARIANLEDELRVELNAIESLRKDVDRMKRSNAEAEVIELRVGGPPHVWCGSENSSGYMHDLKLEDDTVIGTRQIWAEPPAPGVCGASTSFTYEFWPLRPGKCRVVVRFGRPWDSSTMSVVGDFPFVVPEVDEGLANTAIAQAEAKLVDAKAMTASSGLNLEEPLEGGTGAETPAQPIVGAATAGATLMALAEQMDRHERAHKMAQKQASHELAMSKIAEKLSVTKSQRKSLQADCDQLIAAKEHSGDAICQPDHRMIETSATIGATPEEIELADAEAELEAEQGAVEKLRQQLARLKGIEYIPQPTEEQLIATPIEMVAEPIT
eukprot:SAG31_NODE_3860_length_3814_cov_2.455720_5_plen_377_part_00